MIRNRSFSPIVLAIAVVLALPAAASAVTPQISSNWYQTCVLGDAGALQCAGDNSQLSLGDATVGTRSAFAPGPSLTGVTQLAAGETHMCALLADTTVKCWGDANSSQLGNDGATSDTATPQTVLVAPATPLSGVTQIATQYQTTCARKSDGTAWCWGRGNDGQLGDGGTTTHTVAAQVSSLTGVVKVAPGDDHTCAIVTNGDVYCWGDDGSDQLGNGVAGDSPTPVKLDGISGATDIGSGSNFSCALIGDGTVKCWGSDADGQQGNGPGTINNESPATIQGVWGVKKLAVGYMTACVLTFDRRVSCWGYNDENEASSANTDDVIVATDLPGAAGAIDITEQWDETACVLHPGGGVSCWGDNSHGQAGIENALSTVTAPTPVPGLDLVTLAYPATGVTQTQPVKTKLDKKKKTYTVTSQLTGTPNLLVAPAEACAGTATLTAQRSYYTHKTVKVKGKKVKKKVKKIKTYSATGPLALAGESCVSTLSLKLAVKYFNGKKVRFTHSAAGNGSIQAFSAANKFKLPKVKAKKKAHKR